MTERKAHYAVTIERDAAGLPERLVYGIAVESHTTGRPGADDSAIRALVEEVINAYSAACADWQTNSMRELMIEEQITTWRTRLAALLAGR